MAKLEKKAAKIGIPPERVHEIVKRLVPEGFIASFIREPGGKRAAGYPAPAPLADMTHEGRIVMRGEIVSLTEMQVRKYDDDPIRRASAVYFDAMTQDAGRSIPTKTAYLRVAPVEATITKDPPKQKIEINAPIPDPTEVLPIDIVTEMVRKESVIATAECYCRRTQDIMGNPCDHPLNTCLYFNDLALLQAETGRARRINAEEAIQILRDSEEAGLVHNVSNAEGQISTLCNCCLCSCGAMKSLKFRGRNASVPSRFVVNYDVESCTQCEACIEACPMEIITINGRMAIDLDGCIGCGQCAFNCPEGSLSMVARKSTPKIPKDGNAMMRKISFEALIGFAKQKITGVF
jgi:ferredoxin